MSIPISQVIKTFQGEGSCIGQPCILLRTYKCNLACTFCDSKYTWNDSDPTFILSDSNYNEFIDIIKQYNARNLLLTGGEPSIYFDNTLYNQMIVDLLPKFKTIEIETNGSFAPFSTLKLSNFQKIKFNVSPKKVNDIVLDNIKWLKNNNINHNIKIIHISDKYVLEMIDNLHISIDDDNLYILPFTNTNNYETDYIRTAKFCIDNNLNISPRFHMDVFNTAKNEYERII